MKIHFDHSLCFPQTSGGGGEGGVQGVVGNREVRGRGLRTQEKREKKAREREREREKKDFISLQEEEEIKRAQYFTRAKAQKVKGQQCRRRNREYTIK